MLHRNVPLILILMERERQSFGHVQDALKQLDEAIAQSREMEHALRTIVSNTIGEDLAPKAVQHSLDAISEVLTAKHYSEPPTANDIAQKLAAECGHIHKQNPL